ncbi:transglutaminase domain-containing protein, partial [bacterium]|nr:transglutaminase domain-containing protein [bacterium]
MSRLFYNERGFVSHLQYEAVSARRRLRKELVLPDEAQGGGLLYLLARSFPQCQAPLQVTVNDHRAELRPEPLPFFAWHTLAVPPEHLQPGPNRIELGSDSPAFDSWAVALESGYRPAHSWVSSDGGQQWRNERMGLSQTLCGEYVIRLRVDDPQQPDPSPPPVVWETRESPLFAALRDAIPSPIRDRTDPWERARALGSWVSRQWAYRNTDMGVEYAPWDPLTILAWGRADSGLARPHPITMCVHYAVFFVGAALALGLPARMVCCKTGDWHGEGHFVGEVWIERFGKWCQVDPNCDIVFLDSGVPLSMAELAEVGPRAAALATTGPGYDQQSPYVREFVKRLVFTGRVYEHWAVWRRNDFLSAPDALPPDHGSSAYSETDWLWAEPARNAAALGMFPYRLPAASLA